MGPKPKKGYAKVSKGAFIKVPDGKGRVVNMTPAEHRIWLKLGNRPPITDEDFRKWREAQGR